MSLKFNTFRAQRYLRSKFVEGRYLLASEASDLELEILDVLRNVVKNTIGDVALEDAWHVEKLSPTQLLIRTGEAWFKGLPFVNRSNKDQLVTGAILTAGVVPVGISVTDDASGRGKIITLNSGSTTPTNLYKIVINAKEELITEVDDPFLQNANLTEATGQKIRLNLKLNIVPNSLQTETPIPYRDENSTTIAVTNFPNTGGNAAPNLVNQIVVTPVAAGNGELLAITPVTGSERIDGRDLELTVRNDTSLGGGHPIPKGTQEQQAFAHGILIDSNGTSYHVDAIFNDVISTQVIIRLDKEPGQPDPELINTIPYTLVKREVYAQDDSSGLPQGKLYWPIARLNWNATNGILHQSSVTDLRNSVTRLENHEFVSNNKFDLVLSDGGTISWDLASQLVAWSSAFTLMNPHGLSQSIPIATIPVVEGGSLVYEMDLANGGSITRGTLAINVTAFGATSTLSAVDLSTIRVGNIVKDSAGVVAEITAIDDVNNTITTSPSLTANGAATIYKDSYGPAKAPLANNIFVLAIRRNNTIYLFDIGLRDGESDSLETSVSINLLNYVGAPTDSSSQPIYSSNIRGTALENLTARLGILTDAMGDEQEDRSAYFRSASKVTWTGTQLEFPSNIVLEIINTKSGTLSQHTILTAGSPIVLANGESAYVSIDRTLASENVSVVLSGTIAIPAQTQANKDIFVLARRVGAFAEIPLHKQVLEQGSTSYLGAPEPSTGDFIPTTVFDPLSTTLPTGPVVSIDGYTLVNGDTAVFAALTVNPNRLYKVSGIGTSAAWTALSVFEGSLNPNNANTIKVLKGASYKDQIGIFDGTNWKFNDVVRHFNSNGDYFEQLSLKTITIMNNSGGDVFQFGYLASQNVIVDFSIERSGNKDTGQIYLTTDGITANHAVASANLGATGVTFLSDINVSNLRLRYVADNSGSDGSMKFSIRRWSDIDGGPAGFPQYTPLITIPTGYLDSAFAMSDGSGVEINCNAPYLFGGKTRLDLTTFTYTVGLTPGTTAGDLEVIVDGLVLPRFLAGTTLDAYYSEIDNDTVEFWTDLSASPISIEIRRKYGTIDTSSFNEIRIAAIRDAVVGTSAEVLTGRATHSSIAQAISDTSAGGKILLLPGTFVENVSINKKITIIGYGKSSQISGTLTFTSASEGSLVKYVYVTGAITFNASSADNQMSDCWQDNASVITDNGTNNSYTVLGV